MNELPDETTRLLTSLCTDWIPEGSEPSENPALPMSSNPAHYIKIFVNKKQHLMTFLEHQIQVQVNSSLPEVVYNTLLELYLGEIGSCAPNERVTKERKALELLKRPEASYDLHHALVLAQMHDFRAGTLFLYEKAKLYQQILLYQEHNRNELRRRNHAIRSKHPIRFMPDSMAQGNAPTEPDLFNLLYRSGGQQQ